MCEPTSAHIPRDIIERALRSHHNLSFRAEKHRAFATLFVDVQYLAALDTPDWQLIYGRRGSGKTILLGALEEHLQSNPDTLRSLPLRLTAEDAIVPAPYGADFDDEQQVLGYFETFLENLADELASATEQRDETRLGRSPTFWSRLLASSNTAAADRVAELVRDLVGAVRSGTLVSAYAKTVIESSHTHETRSEKRRGAKGSVSVGRKSDASAQVGVGGAHASDTADTAVRSTVGSPVARFRSVRTGLIEIAELLDLESIVILIDEWDLLNARSTQPGFADLLRKAFGGTDKISVKIAADRFNTRLSNAPRHGLEIGADVFEAVNLDRVSLPWPALVDFYAQLLFNRLLFRETRLTGYAPVDDKATAAFLTSIFDDVRAFEELVRGSEGIAREFLVVFNRLAQDHMWVTTPRWSTGDVRDALRAHMVTASDQLRGSVGAQLMTETIKPHTIGENSRVFTVPWKALDSISESVEQLLAQRLIHEIPYAAVPDDVRDEFVVYRLSYGLWLDWERARALGGNAIADGDYLTTPLTLPVARQLSIC